MPGQQLKATKGISITLNLYDVDRFDATTLKNIHYENFSSLLRQHDPAQLQLGDGPASEREAQL